MEKKESKNFVSKFSIKEYVENVKASIEELESLEIGDTKLEKYKSTKAIIADSSKSILKVFLKRALVFLVLAVLFMLSITFIKNSTVQIVVFVILGLFGIYMISPMIPHPLATYQEKLRKMMKKDGVRYKDCTIKEK